ncbi:hypothetical protein QFC22_003716 [Naganishia vaughanmartiniae]|uniref:Uncharacterized protein n=1 Tax=Naganishia vaughanmartiniae TaxID=1424756 RepID=A0ACC2X745_9TREE|nr:hypothetical protein QFC22_003716 [Naganishia vaughanmartiniae]
MSLDQKEIVWPKAKGHDLMNAYEKRLMSIASSDSAVKAASKAQIARDHQAEELNDDDQQAEDDLIVPAIAAGATAPVTPKRPQPVRRTRANAAQEDEPVHDVQEDEAVDDPAAPGEEGVEQERNVTHDENETSPAVDLQEDAEEGNADAVIDATSEGDRPPTDVHVSPPPIAADLRASSPADPTSDDEAEAEPGRATRASSAVSFGDVQPTKRIRR